MAHKSLVDGTSYNITGGKSLVSGTAYNIKGGKTLVGGTGYDIKFTDDAYAMLYSDGDFAFQRGSEVADGKTLTNSYTGFEDTMYVSSSSVPWSTSINNIKNAYFVDEISPTSLSYWFYNAQNLQAANVDLLNCDNVTNMYGAYYSCYNLTGSPVCGNNVINMANTYYGCSNLTGSPICGNSVTSMANTYRGCSNLTGSPVCGDRVTSMILTYYNCRNLTGSPVCGENVVNMYSTYNCCYNITGAPVCGNNVTSMYSAYYNCRNLTGSPVCGANVVNMNRTYYGCSNLSGNAYFYSNRISDVNRCFYGKSNSRMLNIYLPANSTSLTTCLTNNTSSLLGRNCTWTDDMAANGCYYNATLNIYLYPVENVEAARLENESK